jgi:hypothetical protein
MSDCNHHCGSCSKACGDKSPKVETSTQQDLREKPHRLSRIRKVIGIVSGKGGVGKSLVTSSLAVAVRRQGKQTAILDADITGPSIPKIFGLHTKAVATDDGIQPVKTKTGISVMSINLLLDGEATPVIWRGPLIAGIVKQFWTDVIWQDVGVLFVDMPPGTGDVPLTVFQSLPVDGIIIVTSPQELVSMIVEKAVKMAEQMNVPVLGLVENMSYFACPDNGKKYQIFGESHIDDIAKKYGLDVLARLPIEPSIAKACDTGNIESIELPELKDAAKRIANL